jgi:uncharacterized membrane protein SirB2
VDYADWKVLHVAAVVASLAGFALRFGLRFVAPRVLHGRAARTLPHIVDTLLLASAIVMVTIAWPGVPGWIRAKIAGLLVYIVAGAFALRRARTPVAVGTAFAVAVAAAGYIVSVALAKDPLGPFG